MLNRSFFSAFKIMSLGGFIIIFSNQTEQCQMPLENPRNKWLVNGDPQLMDFYNPQDIEPLKTISQPSVINILILDD
jgi:hypothetical protein